MSRVLSPALPPQIQNNASAQDSIHGACAGAAEGNDPEDVSAIVSGGAADPLYVEMSQDSPQSSLPSEGVQLHVDQCARGSSPAPQRSHGMQLAATWRRTAGAK